MAFSSAVPIIHIAASPLFLLLFFSKRWFGISGIFSSVALWVLLAIITIAVFIGWRSDRKIEPGKNINQLLYPFALSLSMLMIFLCISIEDYMPLWIFVIVMYREFGIGFIRLLLSNQRVTLRRRLSGHITTSLYLCGAVAGLLSFTAGRYASTNVDSGVCEAVFLGVFIAVAAAAVWSLSDTIMILLQTLRKSGADSEKNPIDL